MPCSVDTLCTITAIKNLIGKDVLECATISTHFHKKDSLAFGIILAMTVLGVLTTATSVGLERLLDLNHKMGVGVRMGGIRITVTVSLVTADIFLTVTQMHSVNSKENLAKTPRFSNVDATMALKEMEFSVMMRKEF